jgi:hypothetical protein
MERGSRGPAEGDHPIVGSKEPDEAKRAPREKTGEKPVRPKKPDEKKSDD